jgi:ribulose-5-phosphate 4-epimerase/fuculose-1-phosphate aldolase
MEIKQLIVDIAIRAYKMGLVVNTQGNFSARDPETGRIFITPTGFPYERMTAEDIVEVDLNGRKVAGKHEPSSETPVHCAVYQARPNVFGISHTESPYANAFGALGIEIKPVLVSLLVTVGGSVPVMPFSPSGSEEFSKKMLEVMGDRNAVIWANHGLMTVGSNLQIAFERSVFVEECAKVYHLSLQLGQPVLLPEDLFGKIRA